MAKKFEKLKKITEKKSFLVLFSILCGVVAWLFVLDTDNPVIERTISVEMEFVNFSEPAQKNLTLVSDLGVVSADIKISGREDLINNVIPSDLALTVDFSKVTEKGVSYITVDRPSCSKLGVKIEDYYPKEIAVTYDTKMEMYLPVKVDFQEALLKQGYEIVSYTAEPDSVPTSGFASAIENLEYIRVDLTENVVDGSVDGDKTLSFIGRYITTAGQDVTANFGTQIITVKLDVARRIPIRYRIVGELAGDFYLEGDAASQTTVLVDGNNSELAEITEIDLGDIDISNLTETTTWNFNLNDYLQGSLFISGNALVSVRAEIASLEVREFVLNPEDISQTGRNNELYRYSILFDDSILDRDGNIVVRVKGKAADLAELKLSTLRPTLDLSGKEGIYRMQSLTFDVPEGVTLLGEYLADIEITLIQPDTPVPESPNPDATENPEETPGESPKETEDPQSTEPPEPSETPLPGETGSAEPASPTGEPEIASQAGEPF